MDEISRAEEIEQKRSFWKQHIESRQESGISQTEYCQRNNLSRHRLVYWKKRFYHTQTSVSFVPLQLFDPLAHGSLCLVIHDHFNVEIRSGFDPSLLRQLILALRGAA